MGEDVSIFDEDLALCGLGFLIFKSDGSGFEEEFLLLEGLIERGGLALMELLGYGFNFRGGGNFSIDQGNRFLELAEVVGRFKMELFNGKAYEQAEK